MTRPKSNIPPANLTLAAQRGKTEGKPAQVPLAHSLSYIQTIFEKSPVGMMTCKATGEIVSVNPALAQISGGTKEQIENQNFRNLKAWQESGLLSTVEDVLASGVEKTFEGHTFTYFGKEVWVSGLITPFSFEGERYLLVMLTDTTKSKQAEEGIRQSMEELGALNTIGWHASSSLSIDEILSKSVDEIVNTMRTDQAFFFLREGEKLLLKASRAANGKSMPESIPEHRVGECMCGLAVTEGRALYSRDIFNDIRCTWEECKKVGFHSFAALPLRDGEEIIGVLGLASLEERDFEKQSAFLEALASQISLGMRNARMVERIQRELAERKKVEVALRESEERFRRLTQVTFEGIVIHDGGKILDANPAAIAMFGYEHSKVIGEKILKFVAPESQEMIIKRLQEQVDSPVEAFGQRKDGSIFPLEILGRTFHQSGSTLRVTALRDITERKRVEGELSMAETKYRNLVEQMPAATYIDAINETSSTIYFSPQIEVMTGYSPEEWESDPELWIKMLHPDDRERVLAENARTNKAGESFRIEYRLFARDGRTVWVLDEAKMLRDNAGQPLFWQGILLDITERQQAEVDLQRQLKELTVLHEVASAAAKSAGVDELIEHITKTINESLYPDNCGVLLFDEATNVLRPLPSYRGVTETRSLISIPLGQGVTGMAAASRQPARIGNVKNVPYYINVNAEMQSELCVPVIAGERLLGVINAESAKLDAFTVSDEILLITIAGTLATAIEKLHLFEETSRRLEHVQALHRIDTAISNSQDLGLTINIFLEEVMQQLGVHATDILILQPYTLILEYLSGRGFKTKALQHTQLRLGQGYAGMAGQERKTIHVSNLRVHKTDFLRSPDFNFEEFESYYGVPLIAKGQLKGVLEVFQRGPLEGDREWLDFLEILAGQAAIAIDNVTLFNDLQRTNTDLRMAYDATIEGWSRALDLRDEVTEGHTQRVVELTMKLAQEMGINETEQVHVLRGTLLHDIGKLGVPDNILRKPGPLTADEWGIMRKHPLLAYEMLTPISYLHQALDIPFCHHEKWDGNGYPRGLKGEQIPLAARIFSVVDVWDALISDRPYRKAWTRDEALAYIRDQAGKHFDPQVVDIFLREVDTVKG